VFSVKSAQHMAVFDSCL